MSERPDDTDFKLKHIVTALRDVVTEWYDLGIYLDLPEHILKPIGSNRPDVEGRLRMMVSKWLSYDPEASWDKLAAALNDMGKNAIAANIRSKYVRVTGPSDGDKTSMSNTSVAWKNHVSQIVIFFKATSVLALVVTWLIISWPKY